MYNVFNGGNKKKKKRTWLATMAVCTYMLCGRERKGRTVEEGRVDSSFFSSTTLFSAYPNKMSMPRIVYYIVRVRWQSKDEGGGRSVSIGLFRYAEELKRCQSKPTNTRCGMFILRLMQGQFLRGTKFWDRITDHVEKKKKLHFLTADCVDATPLIQKTFFFRFFLPKYDWIVFYIRVQQII